MKNLIIITTILLASCCPKIIGTDVQDRSTTVVTVTPRKHDVHIPRQEINATFDIIKCDSVTNKPIPATGTVRSGKSEMIVKIDSSGILNVLSILDSLVVELETRDSTIYFLNERLVTNTAVVKADIPQFYKTCMWIAISALIIVAIKIYKTFAL